MKEFLTRKNIEFSAKRYGIDALGAMAQGLFCSLLIGTIIKTLGQQLNLAFLVEMGGLTPERAETAACSMEHILSFEEIAAMGERIEQLCPGKEQLK